MTKLREPAWVTRRRLHRERFIANALHDDEDLLAEGALRGWSYIVVTSGRIVWEEGRWSVTLPFEAILWAEQTIEETHRYRLTLHHRPIDRPRDKALPWDLPRHWHRFRNRHRWNRETVLRFSRRDTVVAETIRRELTRRGIPLGPIIVRPHDRDEHAAVLYHPGPRRSWWRTILERWID